MPMTKLLAAFLIVFVSFPAFALDASMKSGLLKLDPETRLEQRCDAEVLDRIARDENPFHPDRVVAYATDTPVMKNDQVKTTGAAFRSTGEWYHLSFKCRTAPDHMHVLALDYQIGKLIPKDEWQKYNLWD